MCTSFCQFLLSYPEGCPEQRLRFCVWYKERGQARVTKSCRLFISLFPVAFFFFFFFFNEEWVAWYRCWGMRVRGDEREICITPLMFKVINLKTVNMRGRGKIFDFISWIRIWNITRHACFYQHGTLMTLTRIFQSLFNESLVAASCHFGKMLTYKITPDWVPLFNLSTWKLHTVPRAPKTPTFTLFNTSLNSR